MDLVNAIESLSPSHREVRLLRDLEDLTIGEIAGRLGVTPEPAKSRLRRARAFGARIFARHKGQRTREHMNYFRGVGMFGSSFLSAHLIRGVA